MGRRWMLLAGAACAGFLAAGGASAQTATPQPEAASSDTIVVTARRVAESLQDVPLSISAFSADTLERAGVSGLRDVAALTPGLNFDDLIGGLFGAPTIRGLSQANVQGPRNVATFLDGVYLSDPGGVDIGVFDLERIEVVKGPVSALYGRNAFAGAINYVTRQPSDAFEAEAELDIGSDNKRRISGAISGPLVEGLLSARLALASDAYDGTYKDGVTGAQLGGFEKFGGSLALRLTPSDRTDIALRVYVADDQLDPSPVFRLNNNCSRATPTAFPGFFCGRVPGADAVNITASNNPNAQGTKREVQIFTLSASHAFDSLTLSAIAGHTSIDLDAYSDADRTRDGEWYQLRASTAPFAVLPNRFAQLQTYTGQVSSTEDSSLELRLAYDKGERFRWSVGGFAYQGKLFNSTTFGLDASGLPAGTGVGDISIAGPAFTFTRLAGVIATPNGQPIAPNLRTRSTLDTDQRSLFATADWEITDRITTRAELRYTEEERSINVPFNLLTFIGNPAGNGLPVIPRASQSFDYWNYRLTGQWQVADNAQLYASVATGANGGGFNAGATVAADFSYGPEENTTWEIGAKTQWFDRRLTANLALYNVDWTDAQILSPPNPTGGGVANVVRNFATVQSTGGELEIAWRALDTLTVNAGYSLADAKFGKNSFDLNAAAIQACREIASCAPRVITIPRPTAANPAATATAINLDGVQTLRTSKHQLNLSVDGSVPDLIGDWDLFGRADYSNDSPQTTLVSGLQEVGRRENLNLSAGLRTARFTVTAYVNNVGDERPATNTTTFVSFGSPFAPPGLRPQGASNFDAIYTNGRVAGVRAKVTF